ncbi:MAG: hypothetical protein JSR72_15045 [Proteobacteria bacterium]|nr:hypothetical protein [Pseudomonadota bacterium]
MADVPHEPNAHIKAFLRYFIALPSAPYYAVMLNGKWGVGKTRLIEDVIADLKQSGKKVHYVSLYGVSHADDITSALFESAYPTISGMKGRVTKIGAKLAKPLLTKFGLSGVSEIKIDDVLKLPEVDLIVFDDLERAAVGTTAVLGYINDFVEHMGMKVVIIANEEEIDKDDYKRKKEKVIGRTLLVHPEFDKAFSAFCREIVFADAKELIESNKQRIAEIFGLSGLDNLRLLQHSLFDFERIWKAADEKYRRHESGGRDVLFSFIAFALEYKAGNLAARDLETRIIEAVYGASKQDGQSPPNPISRLYGKYGEIAGLEENKISGTLLREVLVEGVANSATIDAAFSKSIAFASVAKVPAWVALWRWMDISNELFEKSLKAVEEELASHQYTHRNEVLQVYGVFHWLSDSGIIPESWDELVTRGKAYIAKLVELNRLSGTPEPADDHFGSYGGYGIYKWDEGAMRELASYWDENAKRVFEKSLPEKALGLLQSMMNNPDKFKRNVMFINGFEGDYISYPILAYMDVDAFIDALSSLDAERQRSSLLAISGRYHHSNIGRVLEKEQQWLQRVEAALLHKANTEQSPFSRARWMTMTKLYISPYAKKGVRA